MSSQKRGKNNKSLIFIRKQGKKGDTEVSPGKIFNYLDSL